MIPFTDAVDRSVYESRKKVLGLLALTRLAYDSKEISSEDERR